MQLHKILIPFFALLFSHGVSAQVDSLLRVAESHHKAYRFNDAIEAFDLALDCAEDTTFVVDSALLSSIHERLLLSENGSNMSRFVRKPKVVAKKMFSLDDFYLYYPVENKSWRTLPNPLDGDDSHAFARALYAPDWNDVHYYSAKDENGVRSIFMTELQDTVWTVPCKVEELSTASANEVFPMLSPDRKVMYFASDGMYGLGGYDIYRSEWNESEGKWSMPQNMGMPFSSPEDDFLFVDSEDEKYSVFASTRGCPKDSVWLYSIEYEKYPLHSPVDSPTELLELSRMNPQVKSGKSQSGTASKDDLTEVYMAQMDGVRVLKDSMNVVSSELDKLRMDLAFSNDEAERFELSAEILELEKKIPALQMELESAKIELQKTESEFLKKGIFINTPEKETVEEELPSYDFLKLSHGSPLVLNIAVPEVKFDYSFRVLDEALFAEDQTLPSGIIYQIQLLGGSRKLGAAALKGLSPIYEHRSPSGMYIYRVGRFSTYNEALSYVYKVRELGFESAYLCAFENGKEISVARARTMQEQLKGGFSLCEVLIIPDAGELPPAVAELITAMAVGKDIKRAEMEDGTQIFSVGPFDDQAEAEKVMHAVQEKLHGSVICKSLLD